MSNPQCGVLYDYGVWHRADIDIKISGMALQPGWMGTGFSTCQ